MKPFSFLLLVVVASSVGCSSGTKKQAQVPELEAVEAEQKPQDPVPDPFAKKDKEKPDEPTDEDSKPDTSLEDPSEEAVVQGNVEFAFELYQKLRGQQGNLFLSPHSLSVALAMTYAGARGDTEAQMAGALHFARPQGKLHARFSSILTALEETEGVKLNNADALWPASNFTFESDYLGLIKSSYDSPVTFLDYDNELDKSRKTINKWAKEKTEGRIKQLLKKGLLQKDTKLVLTNAIYFKGDWHTQFDEKNTKKAAFNVTAGKQVKVPMMFQKHFFKFKDDGEVQVLEMPYHGGQVSMLVILPKEADGLKSVEASLSAEKLEELTGGMYKNEVNLYLPRFELKSSFELSDQLKALGMTDAFDEQKADFTGMANLEEMKKKGNLYVSAVIHKAFTKVDEKGTEAAAASAVGMKAASLPAEFRADHPFLFLIRDTAKGNILFMGRLSNPKM